MQRRRDRDFAMELDRQDPLNSFRERFLIPRHSSGKEEIYLCGHSLGLQPKRVEAFVVRELKKWGELGVRGHFEGEDPWLPYHELVTEPMARLAGALPSEVVVMNSTTVNLHLMLVSFYRPTQKRHKILIEAGAFPSDHYAVESQIRFHGFDPATSLVTLAPRDGEDLLRMEDIEAAIQHHGDTLALIMFGVAQFRTGQVFDIARITKLGHEVGSMVCFDLPHAVGNIILKLHEWQVDSAAWCSYKYLNAGPGGMGALFVHQNHAERSDIPRFAGWWGHNKERRFLMEPHFSPIPGAEGWQLSNPPILSLAALRASLEIFADTNMEQLREKSVQLTEYLIYLVKEELADQIKIITPEDPAERGSQISMRVKPQPGSHTKEQGQALFEFLCNQGVACDWREPDLIRVAAMPLYNRFVELFDFVQLMKQFWQR